MGTKRFNTNGNFKDQQKRLVKATFKRAVIVAVHQNSASADVSFAENPSAIVKNVPLAATVPSSLIMVGDKCRVDMFDEANPSDQVVAYVYGRALPLPVKTLFKSGSFQFQASGGNPQTVTHNLGVVPDTIIITPISAITSGGVTYELVLTQSTISATTFQISLDPSDAIYVTFQWTVIKFG